MQMNESMDLNERIKQAARQAVIESGIQRTTYDGHNWSQDSARVRVHYKGPDKYFGVDILCGGHPNFPSNTSLDVLTKQITQELLKRQQSN